MKTIKFESNYGNFAYRMTAEVGEDLTDATAALAVQGLANICYRVAGSAVDKALGVKERKSVLFSAADGERISAAVSKKLVELEGKTPILAALKMSFAVTGQHEFGTAGGDPTKEATELWTKVQAKPEAEFEKALTQLGLDADYDDEKGIAACHAFLRKVKEVQKAALEATKNALGGL